MRREWTVAGVVALTCAAVITAPTAQAGVPQQLTTAQLRPLVLTTAQAVAATGFAGTLKPARPTGFRCGRQQPRKATYCSRIWESTVAAAHPSIVTAASFPSVRSARAQIRDEAARAKGVGTIVRSSATEVVYYFTGLADVGTAAIAQRAIGSRYAYAWCSSPADLPPEPAVACAEALLSAQAARMASG